MATDSSRETTPLLEPGDSQTNQAITASPTSTNNALSTVTNYYLSGKSISSKAQELLQQGALMVVAVSGAGLYIFPSVIYAQRHRHPYAGNTVTMREIVFATGTSVPSLGVLYVATDIFLNLRRAENIPEELKNLLMDTSSNTKRKLEDAGILIGSALSAIPLVFVAIAYPLPVNSEILKIIQDIVVGIDNTVLHFLPLKLAFMHPIYRFPILPLEYLIKACCIKEKNPVLPNVQAEQMRGALMAYLANVQNEMHFSFQFGGDFEYRWMLRKRFGNLSENGDYLKFIVLAFPPDMFSGHEPRAKIHEWIKFAVSLLGAATVWGSCAGYLTSTFNQILALTSGSVGWTAVLSSPSLYFLSVLLTFFGYTFSGQVYDWLTDWREHQPKMPFEFKLYPKTFYALMVVNLYLTLYSYAAAEELIDDTFKGPGWEDVKPYFIWLARTMVPFTSFNAMKDFFKAALRKWAMHFGSDDTKMAARLQTGIEQLLGTMMRVKPEVLIQNQKYLEDLKIIPKVQQEKDLEKADNSSADNQLTSSNTFSSTQPKPKQKNKPYLTYFWSSTKNPETKPETENADVASSRCQCIVL